MTRAIVIGARRRRQGTGPFIAQALRRSGVEVTGVVGTSQESVAEACRELTSTPSGAPRGYTSVDAALHSERAEIVAICSPYAAHRKQLEQVARADCHCLCEKPLWWTGTTQDMEAGTAALVEDFSSRGLLLDAVAQWPHTLLAYDALHGDASRRALTTFAMSLSPMSGGAGMIPDCAPHVLSMLYALAGVGEVEDPDIAYEDASGRDMTVRFRYRFDCGAADIDCRFTATAMRPRAASYAINGHRIERVIHMPDYEIRFDAVGRSIAIEDPLQTHVAEFVRRVRARERTDTRRLEAAMRGLARLARALPNPATGTSP